MPGRVLLICTGNECRSAAAELLLRRALGVHAARFEIWSAGTQATDDAPMHTLTARALDAHGAWPRRHRARRVLREDLQGADLVLCAAREHRVVAVQLDPAAGRRIFTIAEFARLAPRVMDRGDVTTFARAVEAASSLRGAARVADPADDDLPDPVWGDESVHEALVGRLGQLLEPVAALLIRSTAGG